MTDLHATHTPTADEMARERTILAADRTLMAWIRTTLSMIGFGFTISLSSRRQFGNSSVLHSAGWEDS
jgi:uncharacterized membrane protein YidH (DUF202 family)